MGVNALPKQQYQPFYNVLVNDGSHRYAADENLIPVKPQRISHILIGKYFQEFDEKLGYIPNKQLSSHLYPEDEEVLKNFEGIWRKNRTQSNPN